MLVYSSLIVNKEQTLLYERTHAVNTTAEQTNGSGNKQSEKQGRILEGPMGFQVPRGFHGTLGELEILKYNLNRRS